MPAENEYVNHVRLFFVFIETTSGASLVLGDFISPLCVLGWQPVGGNQLLIFGQHLDGRMWDDRRQRRLRS